MNEPTGTALPPSDRDSGSGGPRQVVLLIAAIWFLYLALPATSADSTPALFDFLRGLALGLALLTIGQIRLSAFRGVFGIG